MQESRKIIIGKWNKYLDELVQNKYIQAMKFFIHHTKWTVLEHSIHVARKAILNASKKKDVDYQSLVRGCLLHDFYLYNWRDHEEYHKPHLKKHPQIAFENASKVFGDINDIEKEIITRHMWPVNAKGKIKHKETKICIMADKSCSIKEALSFWKKNNKTKVAIQKEGFETYWKSIGGAEL